MSDRAGVAAFVLSIVGASYQVVSFGLAYVVDHQFSYIYYISLFSNFNSLTILVVFWAIGHLLAKQESQRTTWPAIILGLGVANLGNLIIAWTTPVNTGFPPSNQTLPNDIGLTLLPSPLLLILGGIIGLIAARRPLQ
jgi:hypothetical protein